MTYGGSTPMWQPRGSRAYAVSHASGQQIDPTIVGGQVQADPAAYDVVDFMLGQRGALDDILDETLSGIDDGDIRESGRTFCPGAPSSVLGPHARFPLAVELRECPFGSAGVVHSHVTPHELLAPEHSLPDMGNVLFTEIDASVVLGAETSDVMVAPANKAVARDAFRDALGATVDSTEDIVAAIESREIGNPPAARQRARDALAPLFSMTDTAFPNHAGTIRQMQQGISTSAIRESDLNCGCMAYLHMTAPDDGPAGVNVHEHMGDEVSRHCADLDSGLQDGAVAISDAVKRATEGVDVRNQVVGAIIGSFVGALIERYVFGG